jgi:YggT family protein
MSRRLRGVGETARLRLLWLFNELITFMAVVTDSLYWLIDTLIGLYIWVIIIGAILSWLVAFDVVNTRNRVVYMIGDFTHRLTEPALRPIRRFVPDFGGVDISPLLLILLLIFVRRLLAGLYASLAF